MSDEDREQEQGRLDNARPVVGHDVAQIALAPVDQPRQVVYGERKGRPGDDITDGLAGTDAKPAIGSDAGPAAGYLDLRQTDAIGEERDRRQPDGEPKRA